MIFQFCTPSFLNYRQNIFIIAQSERRVYSESSKLLKRTRVCVCDTQNFQNDLLVIKKFRLQQRTPAFVQAVKLVCHQLASFQILPFTRIQLPGNFNVKNAPYFRGFNPIKPFWPKLQQN